MNSYNKFWIQKSKILNWVEKPKVTLKRQKKNYFKIFPNAKINAYENIIGKNLKKTRTKRQLFVLILIKKYVNILIKILIKW